MNEITIGKVDKDNKNTNAKSTSPVAARSPVWGETQDLKEVVAEQALELPLLKKSMIGDGGANHLKTDTNTSLAARADS